MIIRDGLYSSTGWFEEIDFTVGNSGSGEDCFSWESLSVYFPLHRDTEE